MSTFLKASNRLSRRISALEINRFGTNGSPQILIIKLLKEWLSLYSFVNPSFFTLLMICCGRFQYKSISRKVEHFIWYWPTFTFYKILTKFINLRLTFHKICGYLHSTHILGKNTQRICGKLHRIMWIYTQIIWAKVTYGRMVFTCQTKCWLYG